MRKEDVMKKMNWMAILIYVLTMTFMVGLTHAADTIKLGASYGMSGRIGWIGGDCVEGAKLIIDEVNAKGGIKGKKIELVEYDTKNEPDTARTVIEKLIKKDEVVGILGPVTTTEVQTVTPVVEKNKIPFVVVSGGIEINEKILPEYKKEGKKSYMWALSVGTERQNEVKVLWLKKKGYKNLGNIEPLDQMGDLSQLTYKAWCKKYGLNVVAEERFDNKGTDFVTQMSKIKAANADSIGSMCSGAPAVTLVKNRDQVGMKNVPFMLSDANLSKRFIELLGENTANVYTVAAKIEFVSYLKDSDPQKKVITDFQKKFKEKYNKEPKSWFFAAVGYDSALMFIKAIEAVGIDGEKMRDWLEKQTKFEGAQAFYSWSNLDHRGIGVDQCSVMGIQGDKWVPVN
jgi:branched-chain amino acid transport system substrate-binding protein